MQLPEPLFLAGLAARTAIVLLALVAGIRLLGKRDVGDLNILDVVLVLLLGNAIQNAITTGSGHLAAGIVSAGTLLVADRFLGILFVRSPWLETRLFGGPTVLATDGRLDHAAMKREGVDEEEILAAARKQGLADLSKVHLAILEADGDISIIPVEDEG
jgi:uncharacterized membrane protein YcaP (DUF421 family)